MNAVNGQPRFASSVAISILVDRQPSSTVITAERAGSVDRAPFR